MSYQQHKIPQRHLIMTIKAPNKIDVKMLPISLQVHCNESIDIHINISCVLTKSGAYIK